MATKTESPSTSPTPAPSKTLVKRHINRKSGTTRQRTGCLTCRQRFPPPPTSHPPRLLISVTANVNPIAPRRKKCDETYPICGHCTRLNLVCNREAPQHITIDKNSLPMPTTPSPRERSSSWSLTVPRAPDPIDICTFTDAGRGTNQRFLLQYYTNILSHLLTTNHENNSFLSGSPSNYTERMC